MGWRGLWVGLVAAAAAALLGFAPCALVEGMAAWRQHHRPLRAFEPAHHHHDHHGGELAELDSDAEGYEYVYVVRKRLPSARAVPHSLPRSRAVHSHTTRRTAAHAHERDLVMDLETGEGQGGSHHPHAHPHIFLQSHHRRADQDLEGLEGSEGYAEGSEEDGCDGDDDDAVNLNIAVSGGATAGVGDGTNPNPNPNPFPYPTSSGSFSNYNGNGDNGYNDNALDSEGRPTRRGPQALQPRGGGMGFGWGVHPPSKFGDNCEVSDVDRNCFTFSCTIPPFPFDFETYHLDNSCRFIATLRTAQSSGIGTQPIVRWFGPVTPDGPYRPGDRVSHNFGGLVSQGEYDVGMVCENEHGKTPYIDRNTGDIFKVQLERGECPSQPDPPLVSRDPKHPTHMVVGFHVPDFHDMYDKGVCKVDASVSRRSVEAGEEINVDGQTVFDGKLLVVDMTVKDPLATLEYRVLCRNEFCGEEWSTSDFSLPLSACARETLDSANQNEEVATTVAVDNRLSIPVSLYGVLASGREQERTTIKAGTQSGLSTHISHVWRVRPEHGGHLIMEFRVEKAFQEVLIIEDCVEFPGLADHLAKYTPPAQAKGKPREVTQKKRETVLPLEACRNPTSPAVKACCALNNAEEQQMRSRDACEHLIWIDVEEEDGSRPFQSTKPVGCKFHPASGDAPAVCYFPMRTKARLEEDEQPEKPHSVVTGQAEEGEGPGSALDNVLDRWM